MVHGLKVGVWGYAVVVDGEDRCVVPFDRFLILRNPGLRLHQRKYDIRLQGYLVHKKTPTPL